MEKIEIPYSPREQQLEWHENRKRWNLLLCHRRFGKTVCVINELIKECLICKLNSPRYLYVAPYYNQAKKVAWDYIKYFCAPIPSIKFNEAELRADFPNGGRIQLGGADSPDRYRGQYFDGVALDEYGDMSPELYAKVIRPALADRKGWAVFIGSAKGGTIFEDLFNDVVNDPDWCVRVYKASETGILDRDELKDARKLMTQDEYDQEFECSWTASIRGSYYGDCLQTAQDEGRITAVPHETTLQVDTFWDIGVADSTAIWFVQKYGMEYRFIDCYQNEGEGLQHYIDVLKNKSYSYDRHYAPHDIQVRELSTGKSRLEIAAKLGIKFQMTPNIGVMDGINAARMAFNKIYFDETKCKYGLQALRNYRKEFKEKQRQFGDKPLHDWSSHFADSFRYWAVNQKETKARESKRLVPDIGVA